MNSTETKLIRWGIIGCGDVTEKKSGPAFNKVPNSSLIAVMRRDTAKAKDYAERHGVPKWYDEATALINDPEVNAIYIATPPKYHEEYAIASLKAGKPVYVEKPMSTSLSACLRMEEAARSTGIPLCIAHYRRQLPMFLSIKTLLAEEAIGKIRTIRLSMLQPDQSSIIATTGNNWRVDPDMAGAGLFFDLAPHQLDLIHYFFGPAKESFGIAKNQAGLYKAEDVVTGIMRLENDILFTGQWCFTVSEGMREDIVEINGSAGKISFPVFGHEVEILREGKKEVISFDPPQHIQKPMIEKIVQYFLGKAENPCSAADAIESMQVMDSFTNRK